MAPGHLWAPHLILYGQGLVDPVEGEEDRSEEERELAHAGEPGDGGEGGEGAGEDEVEDDSHPSELQHAGQEDEGGEDLEVPDAADQDDGEEEEADVDSVVPAWSKVTLHDLSSLF